ncbi:MAG: Holliday junction resolvase RuvX [Bacteroidales bacterium]|nr:Holliday junction resolvase RuvX [Bacteroidales bacterium]MBQ3576409.1 Holliday junction resolvase RuvX [Coprobacter sp.]
MARILSIDYGAKRTGVAVTDTLQIIANSLATVATHELMKFLTDYFAKEEVETVVVGLPKQTDGTLSENAARVKTFVSKFKEKFPQINVVMHDERFTTVLAHQAILSGGVKKSARRDKGLADRVSAVIILQSYLEQIKYSKL